MSVKARILSLWRRMVGINTPEILLMKAKKHGMQVGKNVTLINCQIDYGHAFLISIGDDCTITGSALLAHDASTKRDLGYVKVGKIKIGSNVFVGQNSVILPNVEIGDNVIVGAGSVVTKSVPPNSIVVGNPARVTGRYDEYIERYRRILEDTDKRWETYCGNKSEDEIQNMREKLEAGIGFDI